MKLEALQTLAEMRDRGFIGVVRSCAARDHTGKRGGCKESNVSAWFGTVGVEGWLRYRGRVTSSWEGSDEKAKLKTVTTSCTEKGTIFFHTLMFSSANGHSAISCPQIVRIFISIFCFTFPLFFPNPVNNLLLRTFRHHAMVGCHQSA